MLKAVIAVVVVIAIAIGAYVVSSQDKAKAPNLSPAPASSNTQTPSNQSTSQYIDYYEGVIAATSGEKILFFHAPWCPQCRQLDEQIKNGTLPDSITIIKTDYDSMQELRQKYGVTLQTTLVKVDDEGNLIKKYVAYDEPTLASLKENIF